MENAAEDLGGSGALPVVRGRQQAQPQAGRSD